MTTTADRPRAFVLMSFDAEFADVYSDLILKPLEEVGFAVTRADSLLNQRNILADVVTGIAQADLVIADVTGLNPNVMYELGLAHALGKRTVMITQTLDTLPFDLRPYRANEYSVNFKEADKLAELLTDIGAAVVANSADFSNPVQDYAPNALGGQAQVRSAPRTYGETANVGSAESDDEEEELGLLDGLAILQTGADRVKEISERIGEETNEIGSKMSAEAKRLEQIQKNLGPQRSLQPSLGVMRDTARALDGFTDATLPLNDELRSGLNEVITGANVVARSRVIRDEKDLDALRSEYQSLGDLTSVLIDSYFSVSQFANSMATLPPMEARLTTASRRAAGAVTETASVLETAQAEFDRVLAIMRERLEEREPKA